MRSRNLIWFAVLFLCLWFLSGSNIFAQEAANIKLTYKILESQNDGNALIMTVKLKAKNTTVDPIYNLTATNTHTDNISIDANLVTIGDINPGQTVSSAESFIITINIPESEQGAPQSKATWQLEYEDADGSVVGEEVLLE